MYVSWFSPRAPPGASVVAVRIVFVNRVPKSGIPSVSGYDMTTTLPSLISAAAAFVTAGVTRLVAPVWSFGPHGEGGTTLVQSVWAKARVADASTIRTAVTTAAGLMRRLLSPNGALPAKGRCGDGMTEPGRIQWPWFVAYERIGWTS